MKLRVFVVLALLSVILLTGCAESRAYKDYQDEFSTGEYFAYAWRDWILDLTDVVSVEVGVGPCFGLVVMPTELLQTGLLTNNGVMKFGWRNRSIGYTHEERLELGAAWWFHRTLTTEPIMGTASLADETLRPRRLEGFPLRDNTDWHWLDLGGEAGLLFLDVGLHASPKEFLDFGISTVSLPFAVTIGTILRSMGVRVPNVDLCDDDATTTLRQKHNVKLIKQPDGLPPVEILNDAMYLGH
jgi:hypothetical protein